MDRGKIKTISTIARIPQGPGKEMRFVIRESLTGRFLDIRRWWQPEDSQTWCPSARGFSLSPVEIPVAIRGLERALTELGVIAPEPEAAE